MSFVDLYFLGI